MLKIIWPNKNKHFIFLKDLKCNKHQLFYFIFYLNILNQILNYYDLFVFYKGFINSKENRL